MSACQCDCGSDLVDPGCGPMCPKCDAGPDRNDDALISLGSLDATIGYSLDCLRVLTGPVCSTCWNSDGEVVPATIRETYSGWGAPEWFCERCYDRACDSGWAAHCADFYGGSGGMSDQERFEQSRDCGRRM